MLSRVLQILRVVFLLLSIAAGVAYHVWTERPDVVNDLELRVRARRYEEPRETRKAIAEALAADDRDAVLALAGELEAQTRGALPGDRLDAHRKLALELLIEESARRGEHVDELRYADMLHDFNPQIVENELRRARLLGDAGRTAEASAVMGIVGKVAGRSKAVQMQRLELLARDGDGAGFLAEVERQGSTGALFPPVEGHEFRVRSGDRGDWETTSRVELSDSGEQGTYEVSEDLAPPFAVLQARLDLPSGARSIAHGLALRLRSAGGEELAVTSKLRHVNHGRPVNGALAFDGMNDPYFILEFDAPVEAARVELTLSMAPTLPETIVEYFRTEAGRAALERPDPAVAPWVTEHLKEVLDVNAR